MLGQGDTHLLLADERLRNDLAQGESHFREFKSALEGPERNRRRQVKLVARDVGETLVAFANADGGTLVVGAEDDGTVTGLNYADDGIEILKQAPSTHVHPDTPLSDVRVRQLELGGMTVLIFDVQKGTGFVHLTSDGRCLQRRDSDTIPVSSEQIRFERHEQISREYDRQWVDGATVADLRDDLLQRVAEAISPGLSTEKCLQTLGLAEYAGGSLRLRRAALLLFARDARRWHPRSEIRLQQISGTELLTGKDYNVSKDDSQAGNILELLSAGWEQVRQFLVQRRLAGGTFQLQTTYPEDACREAFVNAIAHRDYSAEGRSLEILAFNDKLEIRNPGQLLSTVKLTELRRGTGAHDSRNTYIARVLRELGYMQEMGEGIRRINALMNGHELGPPEIVSEEDSFAITFSQRNLFAPTEQLWLDAYSAFNLSREEKLVVLLGRGGKLIAPSQIWEVLDLVDTEEYRQIIDRLQTKGLLSSQVSRSQAGTIARRQGSGPREVPRFAIRTPDLAERDHREVMEAAVALGNQPRFGKTQYEQIADRLSRQNPYQGAIKLRQLLRWLDLIDQSGNPTDRLVQLWDSGAEDRPDRQRHAQEAASDHVTPQIAPSRDIYVGNLDYQVDEHQLREVFEEVGKVVKITVPRDYLTNANRGFAFVQMSDPAASLKAFMDVDGRSLHGRPLRLGWSFK